MQIKFPPEKQEVAYFAGSKPVDRNKEKSSGMQSIKISSITVMGATFLSIVE